jgi:hypothetical protein
MHKKITRNQYGKSIYTQNIACYLKLLLTTAEAVTTNFQNQSSTPARKSKVKSQKAYKTSLSLI